MLVIVFVRPFSIVLSYVSAVIGNVSMKSEIIANFDNFCNGEIHEWRIMSDFGMAGKLWNANDKIYVSGYGTSEVSKKAYTAQEEIIDKMNEELKEMIEYWGRLR